MSTVNMFGLYGHSEKLIRTITCSEDHKTTAHVEATRFYCPVCREVFIFAPGSPWAIGERDI